MTRGLFVRMSLAALVVVGQGADRPTAACKLDPVEIEALVGSQAKQPDPLPAISGLKLARAALDSPGCFVLFGGGRYGDPKADLEKLTALVADLGPSKVCGKRILHRDALVFHDYRVVFNRRSFFDPCKTELKGPEGYAYLLKPSS